MDHRTAKNRALSDAMREGLRLAAHDAGLWRHWRSTGFYVPGLGTVPLGVNTVRALERRDLVVRSELPADHDAVYANRVRTRGMPGERVMLTDAGRRALRELEL